MGSITKNEIENTNDKDNILKFKHINLNNAEYILLNCYSKDIYRYEPAKIFIDSSYDELINDYVILLPNKKKLIISDIFFQSEKK